MNRVARRSLILTSLLPWVMMVSLPSASSTLLSAMVHWPSTVTASVRLEIFCGARVDPTSARPLVVPDDLSSPPCPDILTNVVLRQIRFIKVLQHGMRRLGISKLDKAAEEISSDNTVALPTATHGSISAAAAPISEPVVEYLTNCAQSAAEPVAEPAAVVAGLVLASVLAAALFNRAATRISFSRFSHLPRVSAHNHAFQQRNTRLNDCTHAFAKCGISGSWWPRPPPMA